MLKQIRTTLGEYLADQNRYTGGGIYVIACYPALGCIYIGIGSDVDKRIRQHLDGDKPLGNFLRNNMADACGFRLDIFASDDQEWRVQYERQLVQYFRPLLNERHLGAG